jgi:hypothetical protein
LFIEQEGFLAFGTHKNKLKTSRSNLWGLDMMPSQ